MRVFISSIFCQPFLLNHVFHTAVEIFGDFLKIAINWIIMKFHCVIHFLFGIVLYIFDRVMLILTYYAEWFHIFVLIIKLACKFQKVVFHNHLSFVHSAHLVIQIMQAGKYTCTDVELNRLYVFMGSISWVDCISIKFGFGRYIGIDGYLLVMVSLLTESWYWKWNSSAGAGVIGMWNFGI